MTEVVVMMLGVEAVVEMVTVVLLYSVVRMGLLVVVVL